MKKLMILVALMLIGCVKEPESSETKGSFDVELLFENDGCKVYRFFDGRYIYYTDCSGKTFYYENTKNGSNTIENNTSK